MTVGSWEISETHLWASCEEDAPTNNAGNPKVGQFNYPGAPTTDPTMVSYTIPLADIGCTAPGDTVFLAAHAVVYDTSSTATVEVISDTNVDVTRFRAGNGATPFEDQVLDEAAVPAWEPCTGYPNCPDPTASPPHDYPDPSLWDNEITNNAALNAGADWIWAASNVQAVLSSDGVTPSEEYAVNFPVLGEVVRFERMFDIPGPPVDGTLYVNCDNGFEARVNSSFAADDNVLGDWQNSDLKQGSVDTTGWQTTTAQDVAALLVEGSNILEIDAANEYMDTDDSNGSGGFNPAGTLVYNPGGCLFLLAAEYSDTEETAWGAGDDFAGNNWATKFTYTTE